MRSIWSGSISFGLLNIPVKLYSAVQESSLDLDMLDSHDGSNIRFKRVNENTGKEVSYDQIVRGYKMNGGYVVLEKEDFENADVKKTKMIEVKSFVNEEEIDPIFYEQPYYLEPEESAMKAYAILRDALAECKKVGITTFVMRSREALAVLKPIKKVIALNIIRFAQEIRSTETLKLPEIVKGKSKEIEMADKLIDQLTEKFNISKYRDTYSDKLLQIIKEKSKGKKISRPKLKITYTRDKDKDLMEMLRASLVKRKAS